MEEPQQRGSCICGVVCVLGRFEDASAQIVCSHSAFYPPYRYISHYKHEVYIIIFCIRMHTYPVNDRHPHPHDSDLASNHVIVPGSFNMFISSLFCDSSHYEEEAAKVLIVGGRDNLRLCPASSSSALSSGDSSIPPLP